MKKIISFILCFTMLISVLVLPATAGQNVPQVTAGTPESAFAEGKDSLIVFVTGIGQSRTFLFDEKYLEPGAFEHGTLKDYENYSRLVAEGDYIDYWNLMYLNFKDAKTIFYLLEVLVSFTMTSVFGKDMISDTLCNKLIRSLMKYHITDENGDMPANVITPRYTCPLSEYPAAYNKSDERYCSKAKELFYNSIPCADAAESRLGEDYEDYLYCFNYSPFSRTDRNVEDLHTFIETILKTNKHGADKVVLVPMSMGATVTSAYLMRYPTVEENHVLRVVSIVGCWDGSDIASDLLTLNFREDSAEQFYHGLMGELITGSSTVPWGKLVMLALRLLPKSALRHLIDHGVTAFTKTLILDTPSMTVLIPSSQYPSLRDKIEKDYVREIADNYYQAQITLKERFAALSAQGVGFSFVSAYGKAFGGYTDSNAFKFMNCAESTNSDEIINIESTAPGTKSVPWNETFTDTAGRELSPEGSIDISGTYFKDSTWYFHGQRHECQWNNTMLALAVDLALGHVKTVRDCDSPDDAYYYPQFNKERFARRLVEENSYLDKFEAYCETNTPTPEQQAVYEKAVAVKNCTVNDPEKDDAAIAEMRQVIVDLGIESPEEEPGKGEIAAAKAITLVDDVVFFFFGAKGYFDR